MQKIICVLPPTYNHNKRAKTVNLCRLVDIGKLCMFFLVCYFGESPGGLCKSLRKKERERLKGRETRSSLSMFCGFNFLE